ncbi:MAG: ADP-forming succinate--CoA ligase subunit beta [Rhodospirillales bacterium]|nr:ADP-forming succinate--CoA ligase subunit beta [Rhodospirillales bacterium]MDE0712173.1 ADP-forming succinate--CoA ligase subunit beta [Rhodospirillales bacterium]
MNVHEYQAKEILAGFGVPVLRGRIAYTATEARAAAQSLGGEVWVVKAQVHAGGRGKAGGIKVARSLDEVAAAADELIGKRLVTPQTGADGTEVGRVYVEEGVSIAAERYVGMTLDRKRGRYVAMVSTEGGVEIEEVAASTPERIRTVVVDPAVGMRPYQARELAFALDLDPDARRSAERTILAMSEAFVATDASLVEINPLAAVGEGMVLALDAKMNFDDNALFRHPDISELRDETEEDPREIEATNYGLSYIKLDGNIGCMVNGAGLAMATLDLITFEGGQPANFLDVGGGATEERVSQAFKIILSDPDVEAVLVNIFGGIMRCDTIAEGIVGAVREVSLHVPLVVRLEGTNVDIGTRILAESGLAITTAGDLGDAARKIVAAIGDHR